MRLPVLIRWAALPTALAVLALIIPISSVPSQEAVSDTAVSSKAGELDLQYIEAELALAKANHAFALEQNSQRSGAYPLVFVAELRLKIELLEVLHKELQSADPQFVAIDVQKAKGELKLAQMQLVADQTLRKTIPDSVSEWQLKRRLLAVESASAWLDKVSDPSFKKLTRLERMQWRFVVLGKDLLELRMATQR
ncbi:MAG: hypothetical protein ACR2PZ_08985 [Pseudomonadales bacterium]